MTVTAAPVLRAHAPRGPWHVLTSDRVDAPARCGATGPWSGVTTLEPRGGENCPACRGGAS